MAVLLRRAQSAEGDPSVARSPSVSVARPPLVSVALGLVLVYGRKSPSGLSGCRDSAVGTTVRGGHPSVTTRTGEWCPCHCVSGIGGSSETGVTLIGTS